MAHFYLMFSIPRWTVKTNRRAELSLFAESRLVEGGAIYNISQFVDWLQFKEDDLIGCQH